MQWQKHLTDLLNDNASKELSEINNYFVENGRALQTVPTDLASLAALNNLLKHLRVTAHSIHERFGPLDDMYNCLAKFDVPVSGGGGKHSRVIVIPPCVGKRSSTPVD